MNRVMPRRPPDTGEASGGYPSAQPSAAQPEKSAGVAPLQDQGGVSSMGDLGGTDFGPLPMLPMPPMPPGSNLPLAVPGSSGTPMAGGRSMTGSAPPGMDMFGGGEGGGGNDEDLMRHILAGLPQGR